MTVLRATRPDTNVSEPERWASMIGGGTLVAYGLSKRDWKGFALAALGGSLLYRGATGHCDVYQAIGVNTAGRGREQGTGRNTSVPYELGTRIDYSIEIDKPAHELFVFWRNFENLPRFMDNLKSVKVLDNNRSHWIARGPANTSIEWDAEVINEIQDQVIGWRSLEKSDIDIAGSVRFEPIGHNRTRVMVSLQYNPPAGSLGVAVAKMTGSNPQKQVEHDMTCFKQLMETGHIRRGNVGVEGPSETLSRRKEAFDRDEVGVASDESFPASDPPSWTPETV